MWPAFTVSPLENTIIKSPLESIYDSTIDTPVSP